MRPSWDEIRRRAKAFSEEWHDAHYEKGETQSFYSDFFDIFDIKRQQVAVCEKQVAEAERPNSLGANSYNMRDYSKALQLFNEAIALNPSHVDSFRNLTRPTPSDDW